MPASRTARPKRSRRAARPIPARSPRQTLSALGAASALGLVVAFGAAAQTVSERALPPASITIPAPITIEDGSILGVAVGMTLSEAKDAAPQAEWAYEPRYMVDFSASCARLDQVEAFCALVFEAPDETPSDRIEAIAVTTPEVATKEGARVGMPIAAVEALYGDVTLSYTWDNEGREYLNFAEAPRYLGFRANRPGDRGGWAGVYPPSEGAVSQSTTDYASDAEITSVWLYDSP
ncbi:MAG: hypothetical protein AAGM38_16720 [Pseudomonadota bacterium]